MFNLSPLLKFVLYFVFTFVCVYYLTRDRLDEKSRYILVGLLIVPYLFMEQINNYDNVPTNTISPYERVSPLVKKGVENKARINPPKIEHYEDVKNLNVSFNKNDVKEQFNNLSQPPKENIPENKPEPKVENPKNIIEKFTNDDISKVIALLQNVQQAQTTNPSTPIDLSSLQVTSTAPLQPLGANGDGLTNEWDQDYVLLNTNKWGPALNPPPVCVSEKQCPVCPSLTNGYPLSLKDWDSTRRVTPPIQANTPAMNA